MLRMWIKFKDQDGRRVIDRATFQTFGCETAIAVASVATELIAGKTADEALNLSGADLSAPLGALPPMKIHCAQLVEGALRSALAPEQAALRSRRSSQRPHPLRPTRRRRRETSQGRPAQDPSEIESDFPMHENTERTLTRDCPAVQIPAGNTIMLPRRQHRLHHPIAGRQLHRRHARWASPASRRRTPTPSGLEVAAASATPAAAHPDGAASMKSASGTSSRPVTIRRFPVNIVDLGLIYDCQITPRNGDGALVTVKMTLTAPGCGMGPVLAQEAKAKIEALPGVGRGRGRTGLGPAMEPGHDLRGRQDAARDYLAKRRCSRGSLTHAW